MSAKKKRMGSQRRSNQNKMDTESLHIEGSASAAEVLQEEKSEAGLLTSPDYSQSETQRSPSSEMTGHRRKLGSSRSKKGRGHVKDSVTESGHKPLEELEEDTKDNDTLEVDLSIETPRYRDLKNPSDGNSSQISLPVSDVMDVLISRSENKQEAHNERETDSGLVSEFHKLEEPKLESIDVCLTQESGDVTSENAHYVDLSTFHTSPVISKSTYMEVSDNASVYSLTEKQNTEAVDTELVRQDKPLHAKPFVGTEAAESPIPSELSTKENLREHTEIECSVEQEIPKEEIHLDEEQSSLIDLSQVEGGHQSEDDLTERETEAEQMQDVQHKLTSSESVRNEAEDTSDTSSVKLTDQLELHWVYRDEDQVEDDIKPTAEQAVHHEVKDFSENRTESSLETLYTEKNAPLASQHQDMLEQPDPDFHPIVSRRKLGSSRRNKGRHHVKDSAAESQNQNEEVQENRNIEAGGTTEITSPAEVVMQEKTVETVLEGMDTSEAVKDDAYNVDISELIHLNVQSGPTADQQLIDQSKSTEMVQEELHSVDSATDPQYKEKDEETEVLIQVGDLYASNLESEFNVKSQDVEFLLTQDVTAEKPSLSEHFETVLTEMDTSASASDEVKDTIDLVSIINVESGPTADQQLIETEYSADEGKMSLPLLEEDLKPATEEAVHHELEEVPSEVEERDSSLPTMHTEINAPLASQHQDMLDKQPDTDFHPIMSRRKLGSSRRNKGRHHVKDSAADSQNQNEEVPQNRGIEAGGTTEIISPAEVVMQEKTVEIVLEGMDTSEAVTDEVKDDTHIVDIPELINLNVKPGPTGDQQLFDQLRSTEIAQEELHSVDSATDPQHKEKDEETEVSPHDGDGDASNLESESSTKLEDVEFLHLEEAPAEKPSLREHIEVDYGVDQEILSLPLEEVHLNQDQNEHVNSSEVGEGHQSTDVFNEKVTEATKIQDTHPVVVTSETETHETMDRSDINSMKLTDQAEISNTYHLTIKSTDDFSTQQDASSPDNKDEQSVKHTMLETLDHKKEDCNIREPQISDVGSRDTEVGQVDEVEDQLEGDLKPTTEEVLHHELKVLSEDVDRDSSLPAIHTEINAPLASQQQDMLDKQPDTDFHPVVSRRKLGSSRRNKGRHRVKDSAADSQNQNEEGDEENRGNETGGTTEIISPAEVVMQEKTVETVLEGMDTSEAVTDEVKDDAHIVDIPELINLNVQPGPTADQQLIDQSKSTEMAQEELHSGDSSTDPQHKEKDEETEISTHDGGGDASNLESESHVKSQDVEFLLTQDVTAEKPSLSEHFETVLTEMDTSASASDEVKDTSDLVSIVNIESSATADQQLIETEYSADEGKMSLQLAEDSYRNEKQTNLSEIGGAHQSNTEATKIQDMPQVIVTSEPLTHAATDSFETYSLNLSATEVGQVQKDEDRAEEDLKPATEEAVHYELKEVPSEDVDRDSSLPTMHTEMNVPLASQHQDMLDKQPDTDFHPIVSRRKLGSSRRNKGRHHVKDSAADSQNQNAEGDEENRANETGGTTEITSSGEVVMQEKTVETVLEGMDTCEAVTDEVKDDAHIVDIPELIHLNVQSGPTVDPQLADQTNTREMPHEDLHSLDSGPKSMKSEEETGTAKQDENVQANNLVKEPHVKSEEKESPKIEISIENISFGENTTQGCNVNEAFVSAQNELTTNEQPNRLVSSSGLTHPQNLEDKVGDVDEEIKTTLQNTQAETHTLDAQLLENLHNVHSEQTQTSIETVEDGGTKKLEELSENHKAEAEDSMNVPRHDELGLQHEAPAVKEARALDEFTHTELFPMSHNETKTVAQLDTYLEENVTAEASMEESSISEAGDECKDQGTPDQSENLQIKPQQKRRKMGSTRRIQMNRKQQEESQTDGNFHTDIDVRDHEKTKVVEELPVMLMEKLSETENPLQSETPKESSALEEEHRSQWNEIIDLMAAVPLQVPPHGEAVVNPVMFANAASVSKSEKNEGVILNTSQPVDFTSAEIHIPSVVAQSSSIAMNQLLPTKPENTATTSIYEMSQSTQNDDKIPESLGKKECEDSIEQKVLKSAELPALEIVKEEAGGGCNNTLDNTREQNILHEGASNTNTEMKNESPDLNLTNRKRKMGSTRRSLGTRPKREDLNEKLVDNTEDAETTVNAGDVTTQSICGIEEKELQLQTEQEDGNSEQGTGKGFETVDYSNTGDTCKTSVLQQLDDENPVSKGSLEVSDQLISDDLPEIPAAAANLDAMSDSAVGGRRRKLGSHRRSRGAQPTKQGEILDTQNGSDARIVKDENVTKTAEKKLDNITEVNESYTNPFSISTSSTSQTVSEKPSERMSPVQHLYPEVQLGQERQKKLSSAHTRGANLSDVMYDVVMIGDSCVGKTSFMKRAQSGKFSLDLPASVGLDSCIWTVIVDGKSVVLHLWDTAGQERFHSLTRQTFHKAQAFFLMYDVSSAESFSAVSYWVNCIKEGAAEDVIVLLLGNKCDHTKRQVQTQQGENLAKEYNFDFMECSAATGENVIESLEAVARLLSQKAVTTEETLVLLKESKPKNKSGCC